MTSLEGNLIHLYNNNGWVNTALAVISNEITEFHLVKHTDNLKQRLRL